MNTQDILNIFLMIGVVVITSCVVYVTFYLLKTLKSITRLSDNLDDTAQSVKDKFSMKVLTAAPALLMSLVRSVLQKKRS